MVDHHNCHLESWLYTNILFHSTHPVSDWVHIIHLVSCIVNLTTHTHTHTPDTHTEPVPFPPPHYQFCQLLSSDPAPLTIPVGYQLTPPLIEQSRWSAVYGDDNSQFALRQMRCVSGGLSVRGRWLMYPDKKSVTIAAGSMAGLWLSLSLSLSLIVDLLQEGIRNVPSPWLVLLHYRPVFSH